MGQSGWGAETPFVVWQNYGHEVMFDRKRESGWNELFGKMPCLWMDTSMKKDQPMAHDSYSHYYTLCGGRYTTKTRDEAKLHKGRRNQTFMSITFGLCVIPLVDSLPSRSVVFFPVKMDAQTMLAANNWNNGNAICLVVPFPLVIFCH